MNGGTVMKRLKNFSKILLVAAIIGIIGLPFALLSQSPSSGSRDADFDRVIQGNARHFIDEG
jgi:hypothetical protein